MSDVVTIKITPKLKEALDYGTKATGCTRSAFIRRCIVDAMSTKTVAFDRRELATVLAALRFWQRMGILDGGYEYDIAADIGSFEPLSDREIDALCERINNT